jgi:hypothetical protein
MVANKIAFSLQCYYYLYSNDIIVFNYIKYYYN